jgi:acyl-CoA thioester hydrolase
MIEVFEYPHTVSGDEIDEQGHANNVAYVAWLQAAALAHSAAIGWPSERYWQLKTGWVVRSHSIEYLKPAMAGDEIIVQTHVAGATKVTSLRVYQIIRKADRQLLARAETNWAFVDHVTGKPTRIPVGLIKAYQGNRRAESSESPD